MLPRLHKGAVFFAESRDRRHDARRGFRLRVVIVGALVEVVEGNRRPDEYAHGLDACGYALAEHRRK